MEYHISLDQLGTVKRIVLFAVEWRVLSDVNLVLFLFSWTYGTLMTKCSEPKPCATLRASNNLTVVLLVMNDAVWAGLKWVPSFVVVTAYRASGFSFENVAV